MSHGSRDNPDPSLILTTTRDRVSSRKITDPTNDEPLDVAHQARVKKSIATVQGLIDQVEVLCRSLPKSVPKAAKDGEIWRVLNKVKGQDTGAGKRAFSSAGITISKRRNRLKSDIVEALQVLKCMLRKDLIFRKSSLMDESDDVEQDDNGKDEPWDVILEDDPDDYDGDSEMSDVET
ncbi:hypothetical protein DFH06DRAFT_1437434 [Mycena polygramma]|nr:hypothetical protein DFH06DRAFT_1437411 [Mycena polygramma]KAJ7633545.1 hypothetical protein DFH06DRAFT_1437434 [Mycena polygramma]